MSGEYERKEAQLTPRDAEVVVASAKITGVYQTSAAFKAWGRESLLLEVVCDNTGANNGVIAVYAEGNLYTDDGADSRWFPVKDFVAETTTKLDTESYPQAKPVRQAVLEYLAMVVPYKALTACRDCFPLGSSRAKYLRLKYRFCNTTGVDSGAPAGILPGVAFNLARN